MVKMALAFSYSDTKTILKSRSLPAQELIERGGALQFEEFVR